MRRVTLNLENDDTSRVEVALETDVDSRLDPILETLDKVYPDHHLQRQQLRLSGETAALSPIEALALYVLREFGDLCDPASSYAQNAERIAGGLDQKAVLLRSMALALRQEAEETG